MKQLLINFAVALACCGAQAQEAQPATSGTRNAGGLLADAPAAPAASTNAVSKPADLVGNSYVNDDKHPLTPGDKVSFQIMEDRGLPIPLQVTESTELDIPYIGRLKVASLTCKQLADTTKQLLEKDYYKKATVIVGLDAMSKVVGKIYVWGPVRNQGPMEIPSNETFTAGKAILRAGGFGDFANKKEVKVIRKTATGNITMKVNLVEVLEKGKTDLDINLEPEDFIIVPQRAINW